MNTTSVVDLQELHGTITRIASDVSTEFGVLVVSREQVLDHAWQWVHDHPHVVDAMVERYDDRWRNHLAKLVRQECRYAALVLKGRADGIPHHVTFFYSEKGIEQLLPSLFGADGWLDAPLPVDDLAIHSRIPAPAGDWVTMLADVSRAVRRLGPGDQLFLKRRYLADATPNELAALYGVPVKAIYDCGYSIARKILRLLGGPRPTQVCNAGCDHPPRAIGVFYGVADDAGTAA